MKNIENSLFFLLSFFTSASLHTMEETKRKISFENSTVKQRALTRATQRSLTPQKGAAKGEGSPLKPAHAHPLALLAGPNAAQTAHLTEKSVTYSNLAQMIAAGLTPESMLSIINQTEYSHKGKCKYEVYLHVSKHSQDPVVQANAYINLHKCYDCGIGISKNFYAALRYYKKASEQSDDVFVRSDAFLWLGTHYYEGKIKPVIAPRQLAAFRKWPYKM